MGEKPGPTTKEFCDEGIGTTGIAGMLPVEAGFVDILAVVVAIEGNGAENVLTNDGTTNVDIYLMHWVRHPNQCPRTITLTL